ncbi:MAG: MFS transporter [Euryarchaeota archaeon]|nr:MFS transporter [Euryarchaeota archaeon]
MNITPFRKLPHDARNLIIYYALAEPGIIGMVIFNAYLLLTGYSVLEVGAIITFASFLTSLFLPLLGYLSDRKINAKYLIMTSESLIGVSFLIYGLATGPVMILAGRLIFSTAMLFTFASSVYEKELYPANNLEEVYIWHWLIPTAAGIASYLAALIYFSLFPNVWAMRVYYIIFGFAGIFYVAYVYFKLPNLPVYRERKKIKLNKKLVPVALAFIFANFSAFFIYGLPFDNIIINYFGSSVAVIVFLGLIGSIIMFGASYLKTRIPKKTWKHIPVIAMGSMGTLASAIFLAPLYIHGNLLFIIYMALYIAHLFFWPLWHMSFKPALLANVPSHSRGTVFSSIMMLNRLANIPLALIAGVFAALFGAFSTAILSAIFAFSTVAIIVRVSK